MVSVSSAEIPTLDNSPAFVHLSLLSFSKTDGPEVGFGAQTIYLANLNLLC